MYKVIVVDDEFIIRKALERVVKWEEHGYIFEGSFSTGIDALDYIKTHDIDLVITDICMPIMDGLELCAKIREISSDIKIVILTGYDDFDYAKRAISFKVYEYISKPITPKEFDNLLQKVKQQLDVEYQKRALLSDSKSNEQIKIYEESQIVKDFLEESEEVDLKHSNLKKLDVSQYCTKYFATVINMLDLGDFEKSNNPVAIKRLSSYSAFNIIKEKLENISSLNAYLLNRDFVIIFASYNSDRANMTDIIKDIIHLIYKLLGIKLVVGIGKEMFSPLDLKVSYKNALKSIEVLEHNTEREPEIFDMQNIGGENLTTVKNALKYMNANYQNTGITLNDVCGAVAMSVSNFSKLFKEATGDTFVSALTNIRIKKAKELLLYTNKKSYEIAKEVGFSDAHYFSMIFKKNIGVTPSAYRKERRYGS